MTSPSVSFMPSSPPSPLRRTSSLPNNNRSSTTRTSSINRDRDHNLKRSPSFKRVSSSFRKWKTSSTNANATDNANHIGGKEEEDDDMTASTLQEDYQQQQPMWMSWIEEGMDFLACAPEGFLENLGVPLLKDEREEKEKKFAKLHEEFFESLLKEQVLEAGINSKEQYVPGSGISSSGGNDVVEEEEEDGISDYENNYDLVDSDMEDSVQSEVSSSSSITLGSTSTQSTSSVKPIIKRRRRHNTQKQQEQEQQQHHLPFHHRLSPKRSKRISPIEAYNRQYNPELEQQRQQEQEQQQQKKKKKKKPFPEDGAISLEDLAAKTLQDPPFFLSPRCQLQKDKDKGMPIGSCIVAEGSQECLEKLRQKMKVVIQVSGEERKASTSIKRKVAKVSQHTSSYIETRSMIELRLGFLSMQYGLLLRWDHQRTGKAVFCLLRKMCRDSFYTKTPDLVHVDQAKTIVTRKETEAPPFVVRSLGQNHAIYQRIQGTEVVYVDPPFRVPQPDAFEPSIITLEILSVGGGVGGGGMPTTNKKKKSKWTVSVTFAGHTEMALLHYHKDEKVYKPKRLPMVWETNQEDPYELELRLFESGKRRKSKSRLHTSMTVPISHLVSQPTPKETKSWQLTMPFGSTTLKLQLNHRSDYTQWLYKELDVRRLEEVKFMSQLTAMTLSPQDEQPMMDWFCEGLCCH